MGVSVGVQPFGYKYSSRLHFGMFKAGKGEENGIVAILGKRPSQNGEIGNNNSNNDENQELVRQQQTPPS
jgi:hypothetical protein